MTEDEWLLCGDPAAMWEKLWFLTVPDHIPSRAYDQKTTADAQARLLRLCACAFCRHDPRVNADPAVQRSIELSEDEADHACDEAAMDDARAQIRPPISRINPFGWDPDWHRYITALGLLETIDDVWCGQVLGELNWLADSSLDKRLQADLIRDIFGNPFRRLVFNPAWLEWNDGAVVRLAEAIYQGRTYDRMPELAIALERAGCDQPAILAHCRATLPHVRGCWVLDALLGRG